MSLIDLYQPLSNYNKNTEDDNDQHYVANIDHSHCYRN